MRTRGLEVAIAALTLAVAVGVKLERRMARPAPVPVAPCVAPAPMPSLPTFRDSAPRPTVVGATLSGRCPGYSFCDAPEVHSTRR